MPKMLKRKGKQQQQEIGGGIPSIQEQKILRQKDHSIVPLPPYLLISKAIDTTCNLPIVHNICPSKEDGGWRSALPNGWGTFPEGKLSHSFSSYFGNDIEKDVTYSDFLASGVALDIPSGASPLSMGHVQATLTNYYNFAFHTSTTTLCDLTNPLAMTVLLVLVLITRTIKKFLLPKFSSLGRRLGRSAHGPNWEHDNHERIIKFGEYVYRFFYHSLVSIYGLWYFWDKDWWNPDMGGTKHLFMGHPNHPVEPGMAWYYLVQSAYNVDALVSLLELSFCVEWVNPLSYSGALDWEDKMAKNENEVNGDVTTAATKRGMGGSMFFWTPLFQITWSPTIRGDFREMMAHHLVTNILINMSSYYRFTRIGSMIFLIHDLSDVPIDMSKLANFVKWKTTTIICFVFMVFMWIGTRLTIFPFVIFKAVLTECFEYLVNQGNIDPALYEAYYIPFYVLLGALILLHVTWFLILLRIGWTLVKKGETHDYSEHKDGEDQGKKKRH